MTPTRTEPRRRADAQRSIAAIVEAARTVLGERHDASMEEIAAAAGVTRQTVYAHFPSREKLIVAVLQAVRDEGLARLDAAGLDELAPVEALRRFLAIAWQLVERCAVLLEPTLARMPEVKKSAASRRSVDVLIEQIVRRGQESGDFDRSLPAQWLVTATHSLVHTAAEQVMAGGLDYADASRLLERSILQLYGVR